MIPITEIQVELRGISKQVNKLSEELMSNSTFTIPKIVYGHYMTSIFKKFQQKLGRK